jgi:ParB-like chromosome segregation protein Spo0J
MIDTTRHALPVGKYQIMPPLTDEEFAVLKADIAKQGVLVTIVLDDEGNVLDGHNRLAAIAQLESENPGLTIPFTSEVRRGMTDEAKRELVMTLNLKRRHLSKEARLELMIKLRQDYGLTYGQIAEASGASRMTVWRSLSDAEFAGRMVAPTMVQGRDGKMYPSGYQQAALMTFKDMQKEERVEQRAVHRSTLSQNFVPSENVDLFASDIKDMGRILAHVQPGSVDAIICDPPYPREFVPLMEDLAAMAKVVLKPGRPLIAMLGHAYLPQYIELMSRHMTYHWIMADILGGANSAQHVWKAFVGWKPLLVFTNGPAQLPYYFLDIVHSPGPDKEFHVWGQDVKTFEYLIYRFTNIGNIVLDPFLGGGTTAMAALKLQRKFVGFDIDPQYVALTTERLTTFNESMVNTDPETRPVVADDARSSDGGQATG